MGYIVYTITHYRLLFRKSKIYSSMPPTKCKNHHKLVGHSRALSTMEWHANVRERAALIGAFGDLKQNFDIMVSTFNKMGYRFKPYRRYPPSQIAILENIKLLAFGNDMCDIIVGLQLISSPIANRPGIPCALVFPHATVDATTPRHMVEMYTIALTVAL